MKKQTHLFSYARYPRRFANAGTDFVRSFSCVILSARTAE